MGDLPRDARVLAHQAPGGALGEARWQALGTGVVLRVCDAAALDVARRALERELGAIDRACSRFRADSEISRVNRRAGRRTSVGPLMVEAVALALRAAELTDGDVDPTIGRALELAGYDRDWRLLDPPGSAGLPPAFVRARVRCDWRAVSLDPVAGRVRVPAGMKLDLGATAKALAADRGAAACAQAAGCGVLVSLGGDIATSGSAPLGGWRIHVTDDHRSSPASDGQDISIAAGGIATSSTTVRRWRSGVAAMHHVIDPATGAPARGPWRTVSVAAATCADANIAATAALVRGRRAAAWLREAGLPARLVAHHGSVTCVAGWPSDARAEHDRRAEDAHGAPGTPAIAPEAAPA